jgi:hypothetical protein
MDLTFKLADVIQLIIVTLTMAGVYWRLDKRVTKNSQDIKTHRDDFDKHELITPTCYKKFEDFRLDIAELKSTDKYKEHYQTQIITNLLSPLLKEMNENMVAYIDNRTSILFKDVEQMRLSNDSFKKDIKESNSEFKTELKEMLSEFKEHTQYVIDQVVKPRK